MTTKIRLYALCAGLLLFGLSAISCNRTSKRSTDVALKKDKEIICYCSNVSRGEIVQAIDNGAKTLDDIRKMTKACTIGRCKEFNPQKKCCAPEIVKILNEKR